MKTIRPSLEPLEDRTVPSTLTILNPEPGFDNEFGGVLAAHGSRIAVGDGSDSPGGVLHSGSVWVHDKATGDLLYKIQNPAAATIDGFATTLVTIGDKLVVGSHSDNSLAGSVHIYDWATGTHVRELVNPAPFAPNRFGYSIAALGGDILIGARGEETQAGAVYRFNGTTGEFLRSYQDPNHAINGGFGWAIAAVGENLLVSAPIIGASAYLIDGDTGATLRTFNSPVAGAFFGYSLAVLNGTFAFGSPHGSAPGAVYLYDADTGAAVGTLANPQAGPGGLGFGRSMAVFSNDLIVTAYQNDPGGLTNAGAAYLFDGTTWDLKTTLTSPEPIAGDFFGTAAVVSGSDLVVGAIFHDVPGFADDGAVYVLGLDTPPTAVSDHYTVKKNHTYYGSSVLANDFDLDGHRLVAVLVSGTSHGQLTFNADGTFVYEPDRAFTGEDSFTYRILANGVYSDPVLVKLTVRNGGGAYKPGQPYPANDWLFALLDAAEWQGNGTATPRADRIRLAGR